MKKLILIFIFALICIETNEQETKSANIEVFELGRFTVTKENGSYQIYCEGYYSGNHRKVTEAIEEIKPYLERL